MNKIILGFIVIIVMFSALACSDDLNQTTNYNNENEQPFLLYDTLGLSNSLNPYDSIGVFHNELLDNISNGISTLTCENYQTELISLISNSFDTLGYSYNQNRIAIQVELIFDNPGILTQDSATYFYSFDPQVKNHLNQLVDIFYNYGDSTDISELIG